MNLFNIEIDQNQYCHLSVLETLMCWQYCKWGTVGFKGGHVNNWPIGENGSEDEWEGEKIGGLTNKKWQSCGELVGSLAAHRGDRAEATGLFHPFSHSAPITYSVLRPSAHAFRLLFAASFCCFLSSSFNIYCFVFFPFLPLLNLTCSFSLLIPQPLFFILWPNSHLFLPLVSPVDRNVRCCCAVDKTQSLSHSSCTWGSCAAVCVRARKTQQERHTQGERHKKAPVSPVRWLIHKCLNKVIQSLKFSDQSIIIPNM